MLVPLPLPQGVTSRQVRTEAELDMYILEAGPRDRPLILLLHGFPELVFSWRRVMPALAAAGYWVVAPDQRGYGRTTGWDGDFDGDLSAFALPCLVRDAVALQRALKRDHVDCLVGRDFGSFVTAWAALIRPDVFRRAVLMSAPFDDPPAIAIADDPGHDALAAMPRPRKHYQWYYSTRAAEADMLHAPQGLHAFLRAYSHMKSADWAGNRVHPLTGWTADELAKMPEYYIMDLAADMPASVVPAMPSAAEIAACDWLPEGALAVYAAEFARTGLCRPRSTGTAAAPTRVSCATCPSTPAGRSRSRSASSPASPTGARASARAPSSGWRRSPAPTTTAPSWSPAPGLGCSRSNPRQSPAGCWSSFRRVRVHAHR